MQKTRLEAFSDGVIAIIITIMVLEMKAPHVLADPGTEHHSATFKDLIPIAPIFLSYVISFIYVGIYWNNHHHMLHTATHVTGGVLWANLHALFWMSLIPFSTAWMGENHFASHPVALYGAVLLMAALGYIILQAAILRVPGGNEILARALGRDWKGKISIAGYVVGIILSFFVPYVSFAIYIVVAIIWLIPDRRIERALHGEQHK